MCQLLIYLNLQVNIENRRKTKFVAQIEVFTKSDLKSVGNKWKFNWKQLYKSEARFYKVVLENEIQGIIKLEEENEAYYVLKNIEIASWNYGSGGKFKNIAEILISYACLKSFELNSGNYKGFLVFKSKGTLIEHYQQKYNAELIYRDRMIINPIVGKQLILSHLEIDIVNEK